MNIYRGFEHCFQRGAVVTVGSFDGVHSGHRKLIALVNEEAHRNDLDPVIITFDPHPREVLRGDNRLLSTLEEKLQLLEEAGAENVIVVEFNREFAAISGTLFAREMLRDRLGARVIFVGEGHSFGHDRGGKVEELLFLGFKVIHIERFDHISSTMVREAIESGDMAHASELLGTGYLVHTPIIKGNKLLPDHNQIYRCEVDGSTLDLTVLELKAYRTAHSVRILG